MDAPGDIGFEILRSLRRILRKVSEHSRSLSHSTGLTVPQLLCLRAVARLEEKPEVTVVMVAQAVRLANATVSRILDRLEHAGFVQRKRSEADRRRVCVSLTTLGRERLKNLPMPLHDAFLRRVDALDASERQELLTSLHRIVEMMEAEDIEAAPMLAPELDIRDPTPRE